MRGGRRRGRARCGDCRGWGPEPAAWDASPVRPVMRRWSSLPCSGSGRSWPPEAPNTDSASFAAAANLARDGFGVVIGLCQRVERGWTPIQPLAMSTPVKSRASRMKPVLALRERPFVQPSQATVQVCRHAADKPRATKRAYGPKEGSGSRLPTPSSHIPKRQEWAVRRFGAAKERFARHAQPPCVVSHSIRAGRAVSAPSARA